MKHCSQCGIEILDPFWIRGVVACKSCFNEYQELETIDSESRLASVLKDKKTRLLELDWLRPMNFNTEQATPLVEIEARQHATDLINALPLPQLAAFWTALDASHAHIKQYLEATRLAAEVKRFCALRDNNILLADRARRDELAKAKVEAKRPKESLDELMNW